MKNKLNELLRVLSGRQDVILALIFICAVFMMILPLPTAVIDIMIAVNLTVSLILLMLAIYTKEPSEFSSFPSILLITTLYRLSLTISTARLILLEHNAGEIITAFGEFVVGGNLTVGLIIFAIMTIIQFIVITKGSERVAEVSARFSLDAMPGKQMSIDGDMRAGTIDAAEAKRQRSIVQRESQLYGAMDGAMKFVKGDAVASIIVVLVNIVGGITIGILQEGMSASEAATTYAVLSVGDALVSQIPALLISITAGIIVTRVPGEDSQNLAADVFYQIGHQPQPLFVAAGFLLLFALIPGFPTVTFCILSACLGGLAYHLHRRPTNLAGSADAAHGHGQVGFLPGAAPLGLQIARRWDTTELRRLLAEFSQKTFDQLGLALPDIEFSTIDKRSEPDNRGVILLYQTPVAALELQPQKLLCVYGGEEAPPGAEPLNMELSGPNVCWLPKGAEADRQAAGDTVYSGEAAIVYAMERVVRRYGKEFLGIQETRFLMDAMEGKYGELVKELQRQVQLARITDVLQRLIEENISIRNLRSIFEALIAWSAKEKDIVILTEYVRMALRRQILAMHTDAQGELVLWTIGGVIENLIRESIRQTAAGAYAALEPEQNQKIIETIRQNLGQSQRGVLLTTIDVRRYLRKIIERELFDVYVVSHQELGEEVTMKILGNIDWLGDEDA